LRDFAHLFCVLMFPTALQPACDAQGTPSRISVAQEDLNPEFVGSIYTLHVTSPEEAFIISWESVPFYDVYSSEVNAQAVLCVTLDSPPFLISNGSAPLCCSELCSVMHTFLVLYAAVVAFCKTVAGYVPLYSIVFYSLLWSCSKAAICEQGREHGSIPSFSLLSAVRISHVLPIRTTASCGSSLASGSVLLQLHCTFALACNAQTHLHVYKTHHCCITPGTQTVESSSGGASSPRARRQMTTTAKIRSQPALSTRRLPPRWQCQRQLRHSVLMV
jgi:hypothetical protein